MIRLLTFARTTAFAALALGAGALLIPEPAEAQGRSGYSGGGGRGMSVSGGGRSMGFSGGGARSMGYASPRMGGGPRAAFGAGGRGYAPRMVAPRVYGGRNIASSRAGYRHAGVNTRHWRPRPPHHRPRPPYYGGGWHGGYYPYWGIGAIGLGLASVAYANNGYYADDCWLERRWVRTNYGRRLMNVRVCYGY